MTPCKKVTRPAVNSFFLHVYQSSRHRTHLPESLNVIFRKVLKRSGQASQSHSHFLTTSSRLCSRIYQQFKSVRINPGHNFSHPKLLFCWRATICCCQALRATSHCSFLFTALHYYYRFTNPYAITTGKREWKARTNL